MLRAEMLTATKSPAKYMLGLYIMKLFHVCFTNGGRMGALL